jgi:rhamnosyl/mannosyltransferase
LTHDLKELAFKQLKLNNTFFIGEVSQEDLIAHYYACDVFCLPSIARSEAFGIVQLEAMACEKPVVSTSLDTGVPFVNQHRKTGLIVPPKDSRALAEAINILLDNKELREEYGKNGRKRVEQYFTKERKAEQTLKVYKEVLSKR